MVRQPIYYIAIQLNVYNVQLADLDVDVGDIVFHQNLPAPGGHDDAVIARERCGYHTDPEDDGEERFGGRILLLGVPDADDIDARPVHFHRLQKGKDPDSKLLFAFPGLLDRVVLDAAELLVRLWAPRTGAGASDQDRARWQAGVVGLGLHLGRRGEERLGCGFTGKWPVGHVGR
jgi:hypothetical protein